MRSAMRCNMCEYMDRAIRRRATPTTCSGRNIAYGRTSLHMCVYAHDCIESDVILTFHGRDAATSLVNSTVMGLSAVISLVVSAASVAAVVALVDDDDDDVVSDDAFDDTSDDALLCASASFSSISSTRAVVPPNPVA